MAGFAAPQIATATIDVNVFDASRRLVPSDFNLFINILDGNRKNRGGGFVTGNGLVETGLPVIGNAADNYAVLASAHGFVQAGFFPVKIQPDAVETVDLMLLPRDSSINFSGAKWGAVMLKGGEFLRALSAGSTDFAAAQQRFSDLMEPNGGSLLACLLNICTAMEQIALPQGNVLSYVKEIIWKTDAANPFRFGPDRFFAYCDAALVRDSANSPVFEPASASLHPGATGSVKQIEFGEANVQLTFHENDKKQIDGVDCIVLEADIDYFRDLGAHSLLEVIPNAFGGKTDPRQVLSLRWMAGRQAEKPEFNPLFTVEQA